MRTAYCVIREQPCYRSDAFRKGLTAAGYRVVNGMPPTPYKPRDVFVIWNRYWSNHEAATKFEKAGGVVLVAENGYYGKDADGVQFYALAGHGHNGSGLWHVGAHGLRLGTLGATPAPWRASGLHVLVCGQRGIGSPTMASPPNWHDDTARSLRKYTGRDIVIRRHPGEVGYKSTHTLEEQLVNAHAVVVWSSGAGVKALMAGVPVFYCAPHWICQDSALAGITSIEYPLLDDGLRELALHKMSWAQWSVAELATGHPFELLAGRGDTSV